MLKTTAVLLLFCLTVSMFAACAAEKEAPAVSDPAPETEIASVPTEAPVPETTVPVIEPGTPVLLKDMPETDITFVPAEITLPQSTLDRYAYIPQVYADMPQIYIDTEDGSNSFATEYTLGDKLLDKIEYVDATVSIDNCAQDMMMSGVEANVKVRGNFTLNYVKKPLRIKFEKKQNMLGLHNGEKFKNWVLLADWKDLSMQNNVMAFYLGNTILGSDGYYCTDFRNVEVYLNGEYWGVYLLVEQQEAKDGKFHIPEVEDDYEGTDIGYLFEYDGYYTSEQQIPDGGGDPTFVIDHYDMPFTQPGYTVKSDINHDSQLAFLSGYVQNVYDIVYSATQKQEYKGFNDDCTGLIDGKFDNAQDAITACIDIQSLADTYILNEIACDPDVAWSSFYISLDMSQQGNKKLTFEGPWDFDSAFGINLDHYLTDIMYVQDSLNPWLTLLKNEEWFQTLVREKWDELKQAGVLDNALALSLYHKDKFRQNYAFNAEKWPSRLTEDNSELCSEVNACTSQGQAADYQYNWLKARFAYLDSIWSKAE